MFKLIALVLTLFTFNAFATIELQKLDFDKTAKTGKLIVKYKGNLSEVPEMSVTGDVIQITVPDSKVAKSIERSVSFASPLKDTQLRAYQTNPTTTKVKALFPYNVGKLKNKVSLKILGNSIELTFPRIKKKLAKAPSYGTILPKPKKKTPKVKKEFLDEKYLNNLLNVEKPKAKEAKKVISDEVQVKQAVGQKSAEETNFSLLKYGGKFVAFLGLVLLLFYFVVSLMKKGFIKKGKLGFLGNTEKIMVLNQHFIAPKKSLMLIKAHNQVFLVSNTDSGIHPISEIKDVAGLLKDEEKTLAGTNFDTKFEEADEDPKTETKIKLKEDIMQSNRESSLSAYSEVKDKIKFSDQIKQKVKDLKSLQ